MSYYDPSVDACNADDICYQDGIEKGKEEYVERLSQRLWRDYRQNYSEVMKIVLEVAEME